MSLSPVLRQFGLAAAVAAVISVGVTNAHATTTLYVGAYGGSFEQMLRKDVIPPFEKSNGDVKVVTVPGDSTTTLAKLEAQKGKAGIDVAFLDDGPMYQAIQLGLCGKLTDAPVYKDLYDIARFKGDRAVAVGLIATGIAYNTHLFKQKGWAPPTSWKDLADPKYKGLLVMPSIINTYGLHALLMEAKLNGGSETNIDPGFAVMKKSIAPNVLSFDPSPGKIAQMFGDDEIALAVWGNGRVQALRDQGLPVKFVYPKEGAVALGMGVCVVASSAHNALAQKFVQYILSPHVQAILAQSQGVGPSNRNTKLPPAVAAEVPSPDEISKLVRVNWDVVNPHRNAWTQRWNREIEQ
ncbi:MAG: ABC transporter substrate-binding protein [Burkholderiales bacterium]|nr:ABC transporter substrate-binding protein [Burkholderiales bacterium]MDE2289289.1 ABC transporter substrate-binding protein [Burkholderiales bacterium]MDE2610548.1 ABC transporter substrate-binding protein [Burkholderiales bacterium]